VGLECQALETKFSRKRCSRRHRSRKWSASCKMECSWKTSNFIRERRRSISETTI